MAIFFLPKESGGDSVLWFVCFRIKKIINIICINITIITIPIFSSLTITILILLINNRIFGPPCIVLLKKLWWKKGMNNFCVFSQGFYIGTVKWTIQLRVSDVRQRRAYLVESGAPRQAVGTAQYSTESGTWARREHNRDTESTAFECVHVYTQSRPAGGQQAAGSRQPVIDRQTLAHLLQRLAANGTQRYVTTTVPDRVAQNWPTVSC